MAYGQEQHKIRQTSDGDTNLSLLAFEAAIVSCLFDSADATGACQLYPTLNCHRAHHPSAFQLVYQLHININWIFVVPIHRSTGSAKERISHCHLQGCENANHRMNQIVY